MARPSSSLMRSAVPHREGFIPYEIVFGRPVSLLPRLRDQQLAALPLPWLRRWMTLHHGSTTPRSGQWELGCGQADSLQPEDKKDFRVPGLFYSLPHHLLLKRVFCTIAINTGHGLTPAALRPGLETEEDRSRESISHGCHKMKDGTRSSATTNEPTPALTCVH